MDDLMFYEKFRANVRTRRVRGPNTGCLVQEASVYKSGIRNSLNNAVNFPWRQSTEQHCL